MLAGETPTVMCTCDGTGHPESSSIQKRDDKWHQHWIHILLATWRHRVTHPSVRRSDTTYDIKHDVPWQQSGPSCTRNTVGVSWERRSTESGSWRATAATVHSYSGKVGDTRCIYIYVLISIYIYIPWSCRFFCVVLRRRRRVVDDQEDHGKFW